MVSRTCCPYVSVCGCEAVRGAAALKLCEGANDQRLVSFWDLGLKTGIWASRLGFVPQGRNFGLKAGIWTSRLGFGPQGWDPGLKARF